MWCLQNRCIKIIPWHILLVDEGMTICYWRQVARLLLNYTNCGCRYYFWTFSEHFRFSYYTNFAGANVPRPVEQSAKYVRFEKEYLQISDAFNCLRLRYVGMRMSFRWVFISFSLIHFFLVKLWGLIKWMRLMFWMYFFCHCSNKFKKWLQWRNWKTKRLIARKHLKRQTREFATPWIKTCCDLNM